jgi:hypothetical protein
MKAYLLAQALRHENLWKMEVWIHVYLTSALEFNDRFYAPKIMLKM